MQTNALVFLQGNPEQGGLLQVNTHRLDLSPIAWVFVSIVAAEMPRYVEYRHGVHR